MDPLRIIGLGKAELFKVVQNVGVDSTFYTKNDGVECNLFGFLPLA